MPHTLIIKNACIVDGTGSPAFRGDVAIDGDRITRIGELGTAAADHVIDAAGRVLCPGFIELHTHYDPQLCWDKTASPAAEHGVTTVVTGNCSLSLAPVRSGEQGKITRMFHRIEDLAPEFFAQAVPYNWESFDQFTDSLRGGLGVNVGAVVGHSTLRHYVMGSAAQERKATFDEIGEMCALLAAALKAGGFGLSLSYAHVSDENGVPVASSWACTKERIALARVVHACGRAYIQSNIDLLDEGKRAAQIDELARVALESGTCITALGIMENPITPDGWRKELALVADWRARGANLFLETQVRPMDLTFSLSGNWIVAYYMPTWAGIMTGDAEARMRGFGDPNLRAQLHAETATFAKLFNCIYLREGGGAFNAGQVGRRIADVARERQVTLTDAMLDIALGDGLRAVFDWRDAIHADVEVVAEMLDHPCVKIGGSDAGAHITQFCGEGDSTYLLERYVRMHGKLSIERAIHRITGELAQDFKIDRRGVVAVGNFADLVIFDRDTVTRGVEYLTDDVPGNGKRYIRNASGIDKVIVNGKVFVDNGRYSAERAGTLV
jgi:N-acyl-D-aspartate/D-glutamate deacylase